MTPGWDAGLYETFDPGAPPDDDLDQRARTRARVDDLARQSRARSAFARQSHQERLTAMLKRHNEAIDPPADPYTGIRVTDETRTLMGAAPYRAALPKPTEPSFDEDPEHAEAS